MLNRAKLIQQLKLFGDDLFVDYSHEYNLAFEVWNKVVSDPTFCYKVRAAKSPWPLPFWEGRLDETFPILPQKEPYYVLSVDGSQIYPDKHQGTNCYLINIGTVELPYGFASFRVVLDTEPTLFLGDDHKEGVASMDMINCKRQELELSAGFAKSKEIKKEKSISPIFLFDGSLIFWHLASKDIEIKNNFLSSYLALLNNLYDQQVLMAGYISMPKSKELVNLVRIALCDFDSKNIKQADKISHIIDTNITNFYLSPYSRTTVFKNNITISSEYPDHLRTYFYYLHVGNEIARIEIPAWIAQDEEKITLVSRIILDQCKKGFGYPVALAEAHEQAVVKGPDREFFYHLITKMALEKNKRVQISQKSLKKRGISI